MSGQVLVGCEFTGVVRRAFRSAGFDAWSCDILPAEDNSPHHIQGDVRPLLESGEWQMAILHPPCTRLTNAGARWLRKPPPGKTMVQIWREFFEGAELFSDCLNANIKYVAVENPIMHCHAKEAISGYRKYAQTVQPWQFGHPETKRTCLWLSEGMPLLEPTNIVEGRKPRVHHMSPGPERSKERSRFFPGIADAMVAKWGALLASPTPTDSEVK